MNGEKYLGRFARLFLAAVAAWLVILGIFNLRHPSDWAMGDWLINYSGGFVRRGLTGQFALVLRGLHFPLLWTILLLQYALYAVILLQVLRLTYRTRWRWWSTALFFSPATLAFVLLDPPFAYRKDILFFALLSLVLNGEKGTRSADNRNDPWLARSLLLGLGCAVCVLSHEGLIVFFPYLFAGTYLVYCDVRRTIRIVAIPAVISAGLFAFASRFPGNSRIAQAVCNSIGGSLTTPPSGICGGAIDYLTHTAAYAHQQVLLVMLSGHFWQRIPWLFLLPLLPVALGIAQLWQSRRPAAQVILMTSALAWLLSSSLFYYGTDWTRWIYIHIFSLMLLMLHAAGQRSSGEKEQRSMLFQPENSRRWIASALLLMYCFGWELTVYGQRPLYGSFLRFVAHNMARGHQ